MSVFQFTNPNKPVEWNNIQQVTLKVLVVFFALFTIPLDWKFYRDLAGLDWTGLNYTVFFEISRYLPRFFSDAPVLFDVFVVLILSLVVGILWNRYSKRKTDHDQLYYSLFVLVRYRLAFSLAVYGFLKVFPILAPYPSLTLLNTPYGDLSAWKIFNLSLGVVPDYQAFLGLWDLLAVLLLLHRKTASIGAFIAILVLGNVALSHLAYEGGEFVYSSVLTLFALFVFAHDLPRYISILYLRQRTLPGTFKPTWSGAGLSHWAYIAKASFIAVFLGFYGFQVYQGHQQGIGKFPNTEGVPGLTGVYDVAYFAIDGDTIPYGVSHPERWEKVVFEQWAGVSVKAQGYKATDLNNVERFIVSHQDRNFDIEGIQGWRIFDYVPADANRLELREKPDGIDKDTRAWTYHRAENGHIHVEFQDENDRKVEAELSPLNKKYLIEEAFKVGRRSRLEL